MKIINTKDVSKDCLKEYIEGLLIKQAIAQHIERIQNDDEIWNDGIPVEAWIERIEEYDDVTVVVAYESGKTYEYNMIDLGSKDMSIKERK